MSEISPVYVAPESIRFAMHDQRNTIVVDHRVIYRISGVPGMQRLATVFTYAYDAIADCIVLTATRSVGTEEDATNFEVAIPLRGEFEVTPAMLDALERKIQEFVRISEQ